MKKIILGILLLIPLMSKANTFEVNGIYYEFHVGGVAVTDDGGSFNYSGNITIPNSVIYDGRSYDVIAIGEDAFAFCNELTSVVIGDNVKSIYNGAFYNCPKLTSVVLSEKVEYMESNFVGCPKLTEPIYNSKLFAFLPRSYEGSYTVPEGIRTIGGGAFTSCSQLTDVHLPNSIETICGGAFSGCSQLSSINLPENLKTIEGGTFASCRQLASIDLPEGLEVIGPGAFESCSSLESVHLPSSLTKIGDAFGFCDKLNEIHINSLSQWFKALQGIDNEHWFFNPQMTLYMNGKPVVDVIIPEDITGSISGYTFAGYEKLETIVLHENVTTFWGRNVNGCKNLKRIICKGTAAPYLYLDSNEYDDPPYIYDVHCDVIIPSGSQSSYISHGWTQYSGLNLVECEHSGTCGTDLSWGYKDGSLLIWGKGAMNDYYKMGNQTNIPWNVCGLTSIQEAKIVDGVTSIGSAAFNGCTNLRTVHLPQSLTSIAKSAFALSGLTSVVISEGVTAISDATFNSCSNLTSVTIPESVTSIGYGAFYGCNKLTSITLPDKVTQIDSHAFGDCYRLKDFWCEATNVPSAEEDIFGGCNLSDATLHVPASAIADYRNTEPWSGFGSIVTIEDVCAKPTITFKGGKVWFNCETEDVEFVSRVSLGGPQDEQVGNGISLGATFTVSVFARREGYLDSETATKTIAVSSLGDLNGDGQVTIADVTSLVNVILGK
ncbi:MAG: leucine-rich repeat protein [Bacteroidaceae bacterium]|nr:leucine-rich repeat protein [Bacteroidaceae bacterium]